MDVVFFIYAASPRVNNSIKLIQILKLIIIFAKKQKTNKKSMDYDNKHHIYKYIYDNISAVLKRNELNRYSQVETLYLLTILPELGKEYWLEEKTLCKYFHIEENENKDCYYKENLNYLSITVILFYIRNKKKYSKLRRSIEKEILNKIRSNEKNILKNTEFILLILDTIACPYINKNIKTQILSLVGVPNNDSLHCEIINKVDCWFTKWNSFNFEKELDSKRSQQVY
jgi:hypothetical protein